MISAVSILLTGQVPAQEEAKVYVDLVLNRGDLSTEELKDSLSALDYSTLWTFTENCFVYGFIGENYQRLRMKFLSVEHDRLQPDIYAVQGKSRVRSTTCALHGELAIEHVRRNPDPDYDVEGVYKDSLIHGFFTVTGAYRFIEDSTCAHAGSFQGKFISWFYLDADGRVRYDDVIDVADGYTNNEFVGDWRAKNGGTIKRCNWGDWRIPDSGEFDAGAGEFSPD